MEGIIKGNTHVSSSLMASSQPPLVRGSPYPYDDANEKSKVENSTVSDVFIDDNSKSGQPQGTKPILSLNYDLDMDPTKINRVMLNRLSAHRSKEKKAQYLANLEFQVKAYEAQIADLLQQVVSYENQKLLIMLENEKSDREIATLRKEQSLREAEIEKDKDEVNMLRKVHIMQQEKLKALRICNGSLDPMLNGQVSNYYSNTYQGNGEETNDIPPTLSQMWINGVQDEHEVNLNQGNYVELVEISTQNAPNPNV